MNLKLPSSGQVLTEAMIVIAGAVVAAWFIGQAGPLRDWIAAQWGQARPGGGCNCGGGQGA